LPQIIGSSTQFILGGGGRNAALPGMNLVMTAGGAGLHIRDSNQAFKNHAKSLKSPPGNKPPAQNDLLTPPPPYENRKSFVVESSHLGDRKNLNLNNLHTLNKGGHQAAQ